MKASRLAAMIISILFLSSCNINTNQNKTKTTDDLNSLYTTESSSQELKETSRQRLTQTEIEVSSLSLEEGEKIDLPDIGLKGVFVYKKVRTQSISFENQPLYVYVLSDFCYRADPYHNSYLAVETGSKVLIHDLENASYDDTLYSCNVDNDGLDEIIIHQSVGAAGGAGQFVSRIFKVINNELREIFNSCVDISTRKENLFDTGFRSVFLEGKKLQIFNINTGYSVVFDISKEYTNDFFDQTGKGISKHNIECDSFFNFIPKNIDDDDVFEIECIQYTWLLGHADGVGYAKSILKFDNISNQFKIIQSEFLCEEDSFL